MDDGRPTTRTGLPCLPLRSARSVYRTMSATEIIREIQRLTPEERREVQAYLVHSNRAGDPAWRDELARRIDEARAGRSLTSAEVRALVSQAKTNG